MSLLRNGMNEERTELGEITEQIKTDQAHGVGQPAPNPQDLSALERTEVHRQKAKCDGHEHNRLKLHELSKFWKETSSYRSRKNRQMQAPCDTAQVEPARKQLCAGRGD